MDKIYQSADVVEAPLQEWNEAFRILSATLEPSNRRPNDRHAAFADLLTASCHAQNSYANHTDVPICAALFAEASPYRTNTDTINLFEVRADASPASLRDPTTNLPLDQTLTNTFLARTARATYNRALDLNSHGRLALIDALLRAAQPGDLVAVLLGCDVPVILRPKSKLDFATRMSHGIFEFVGEAYVQGIMHAEAMELAEEIVASGGQQYAGRIFLV